MLKQQPDANHEDDSNKGEQPTIESLQKQIENLNKGIATYRTDAKKAQEETSTFRAKIEELEKTLTDKKKDIDDTSDTPISKEDQKRLESWAKQQGFATKAELEAEKNRLQIDSIKAVESQAIDEFIEKHPEYDKDENWDELKAEFSQYKQPTTLVAYRNLLTKIHKQLNPSDDGSAKARAEIETRKRLGLSKGSQASNEGEMTIEKLQDKYPRLSKEQIESRLSEIQALYPKKSKK